MCCKSTCSDNIIYVLDITQCTDSVCQNGGTCIEGLNSFRCICPDNYAGRVCDISKINFMK